MATPATPVAVNWPYFRNRFQNSLDANFVSGGRFSTAANHFSSAYTELLLTLNRLSQELAQEDPADAIGNFDEALEFLEQFYDRLRDNYDEFSTLRNFYNQTWDKLDQASRQPFSSFDTRIRTHIIRMTLLVADNAPATEQAWTGDHMVNHKRFQRIYSNFINLDQLFDEPEEPPGFPKDENITTERCRMLIFQSQELLTQAVRSLGLPIHLAAVPEGLFDDTRRPTYVDFSCKSDEYMYGLGGRTGVLELRSKLGGPITQDQEKKTRNAAKRGAPSDGAQPPEAKRRRTQTYDMTMQQVDLDIHDVYTDAGFKGRTAKPELKRRLVTPTVEKEDAATLENYRRDLTRELTRLRTTFYPPEAVPDSQEERELLITQLRDEIDVVRRQVKEVDHVDEDDDRVRAARIAANSLKFLRSLLLKLILSSDPPATRTVLRQALADRLEDWVSHEEAWSAGDRATASLATTNRDLKSLLDDRVNRRDENITSWQNLLDEHNKPGDEEIMHTSLLDILEPARPIRTVFTDRIAEQRREGMTIKRAMNHLLGPPPRGETYGDTGSYRWEDEKAIAAIESLVGEGGPPDHADIPRATVFERFTYMVVMTHWRCFQAKDL
ncbi:hypothetical protein F4819DRAFT_504184 [Hypoxylon fuscum]|nr:hypothetical protein F4819DRAFT_504184 [Hypoxylon fuscum]